MCAVVGLRGIVARRNIESFSGFFRLEGKTHVMFIASIVRNHLFQELKENRGKDKKNFTVPAAISELEK